MDTYSWLRELADSWVLLAMTLFYIGAILWVFRPGSTRMYKDISDIPLRNERPEAACGNNCEDCACAGASLTVPEIK